MDLGAGVMSSVDIIVPCYRYGHFLRECVESVLAQEGVAVRVLILDDASPDHTPEVGRELAARDSRVEYRRHPTNRGNIDTYNEGLDWAGGDFVLILSADDLLLPGALGRAARLMEAHPEVGLVYGRILIHRSGEPLPEPERAQSDMWRVCDGLTWIESLGRKMGGGIDSPTVVLRTDLHNRIGRFRKDLPHSGDIELWIRFALNSSIGIVDAEQAIYRVHGHNMHSARDGIPTQLFQDRWLAFKHAFERYPDDSPARRHVEDTTYRLIARSAIWTACRAFDQGDFSSVLVEQLRDFALQVYPEATTLREYAGLQLRMRWGPRSWRLLRGLAFWKKRPNTAVRDHVGRPAFLSMR